MPSPRHSIVHSGWLLLAIVSWNCQGCGGGASSAGGAADPPRPTAAPAAGQIQAMLRSAGDALPARRLGAVRALEKADHPAGWAKIEELAAKDGDASVRAEAVKALKRRQPPPAPH